MGIWLALVKVLDIDHGHKQSVIRHSGLLERRMFYILMHEDDIAFEKGKGLAVV